MKLLFFISLIVGMASARANLIGPTIVDINGDGHTPGGQSTEHILLHASGILGLPLDDLLRHNSATDFDDGVFSIDVTATGHAIVSWDNLPLGDHVNGVYVFGGGRANLYGVTADQQLIGGGEIVTPLNASGNTPGIGHILILGTHGNPVPDSGSAAMLLGIGLIGLDAMRRKLRIT